jgi:hypothetical protein
VASQPDDVARYLAAGSLLVSLLALASARLDIRRKGVRYRASITWYMNGLLKIRIANPTDGDVTLKLSLCGTNSRFAKYAAVPLLILHPVTPGVEWRTLEDVARDVEGPSHSSNQPVTIPPKQSVEWRFDLHSKWRPDYVAAVVENGIGGLGRSRYEASPARALRKRDGVAVSGRRDSS